MLGTSLLDNLALHLAASIPNMTYQKAEKATMPKLLELSQEAAVGDFLVFPDGSRWVKQ